jgi:hypothetical protein
MCAVNVWSKATAERVLDTVVATWLVAPWLVLLVLKFFVLIAKGKAETLVAEAALSLVALLLEL